MVCRSTPGNSALTTYARLHSGVDDVQVLSMFHELRSEAPAEAHAPTSDEYVHFLQRVAEDVRADASLSSARRASLLDRLTRAEATRPDGATYYAWRTVSERAVRARTALNAHFRLIAERHGRSLAEVQSAYAVLTGENREQGRLAPRPPEHLAYDTSGVPADRATRYALALLHQAGPAAASSVDASDAADAAVRAWTPAEHCPQCGQFTSAGHACTTAPTAAAGAETVAAADPIPEQEAPVTSSQDDGQGPASGDDPHVPDVQDEPVRQRTALRTYTDGTTSVRMVNLSQARTQLREAREQDAIAAVPLEPIEVRFEGASSADAAVVSGSVLAQDTGLRRTRARDRFEVGAPERSLRCTCEQYAAAYDCPHLREAVEQVRARLNDRDAVATAPVAAVERVRADLLGEYQDSLAAQQQARADFSDTSTGVAYAEDMSAFQAAWDEAKARLAAGETALPYLTENATGGLGARQGGRSFGIEIEVDFPEDTTWQAKNRVAAEMYEAGLSQEPVVHGWHYAGRVTDSRGRSMGGGYSDAPNRWSVEFDRSVDDVGGQRGCEIVSPIMYDEAQTWENIAKVCEIVERHGGRATPRTGLHVNVGAADFDHTVGNHNRLLRLSEAYEDVIVRCAHNPASGASHRGRDYCGPSQVPAEGYRRIRDAQVANSHRAMVNLDHVPAEGQNVTSSTRVEVRIFDGTTDKGRVQTNIKVALGLVNAATRGVEPTGPTERAGTHRAANSTGNGRARRLRGQEWEADTATFRSFADAVFSREQDKAQLVGAFAASRWQRR